LPSDDEADGPVESPVWLPWAVSAKSREAVREQAARLAASVRASGAGALDVAHSLVSTRVAMEHRAVVVGSGPDDLLDGLDALAAGQPAPGLVEGTATEDGGTVFVFPGQGSQWAGMAVELLDTSPVFA
ncbi:acyltransferase domain-containing protein, partial [Streptomyces sp. SID7804]|uniref:acyltransferase domain-containing protein n=1 Tax=Streptomyces sp. SID7804 TaxID=2690327 RepID=UPI00136B70C4